MDCEHRNFKALVKIHRLLKNGSETEVGCYTADIRITCAECELPFEFVGLKAGWMATKPMVDVSAQQLRAPIKPKGLAMLPGIPGFTVRVN